jgi:hypothetical protein
MIRTHGLHRVLFLALAAWAAAGLSPGTASAASPPRRVEISTGEDGDDYLVGTLAPKAKVTQSDTVWIADWSLCRFDGPDASAVRKLLLVR